MHLDFYSVSDKGLSMISKVRGEFIILIFFMRCECDIYGN